MADSLIQAELLAACSGLGYSDGLRYYKEADCLETTKDLIRYLKRDDDSHHIRRALGETKVIQTDLIPILKFYAEDKELFDVTLRLVVNLTNPVLLLFKEELPEEKITRQQYLQMIAHQQSFKTAFADEAVWSILVGRLGEILNKDWDEREEEERLVVERILILVRNVLAVAASPDEEKRTDDDASIHDQVLWALHLARFEDLLLYISSSNNEQELCLHVIEIISKMLKEQDASQLASAGIQRSQSEKEKDEKELMEIRKREALAKQQKIKKHYSARHSRFGGTYYVMNMKSISERDMIAHKHVTDIESLSFDQRKRSRKTPKNRMPLKDCDVTRRSTLAIRLFLQEFCIEFLNGAFNSLMYIVKDNLNRARAQEHDEIYYLWAIEFFLKFNRCHNFKIELTTEVLNIQIFHYIQTLMENYYENMTTDKKKIPLWSRRMHKGLKAYQELLMTLSFMDKSAIESVRESSKILKNKVFYVVEYRELVLILLQNFDELKMTMNYLRDLVETAHVFLKLLEGICGKQRHLVVQKKKIKKIKPKKKNKTDSLAFPTEEELVIQWDEKSDTLLSVIKGDIGELPTTFPYDPVSDVPEEEQKELSMKKINLLLRKGDFHEAVSLLRTSRGLWPEGDIFGSETMDPLEESLCLRAIFMANINPSEPTSHISEEEEDMEEDSDEEEEKQEVQLSEQEFNLVGFIRRFGHIKVLQAYCLLFKNFFTNGDNVNHCILKLFHRLAWDCKLVAIFFQASLFKTFLKIFDEYDPSVHSHVDAVKFGKFIFKKFLLTAEENKKVFMELLFWKTNKDAVEIECGYGNSEDNNTKRAPWSEEEEDELRRLYEEFKDVQSEDKDVADHITDNLINRNRTRRGVIKKLKELYIISDVKELRKKTVKVKEWKQWSKEQIAELRSLVEEFKDAVNPMQRILDRMSVKRPKNRVVDKIMELGLVENRKELQKKRALGGNRKSKTGEDFLKANEASDDDDVDSSEDDDEPAERGNEIITRDSDDDSSDGEPSSLRGSIKSKERTSQPALPTPGLINSRLTKVLDEGWREAVEWISNLLDETADERESDGDFEPIPLITITSVTSRAMEDEIFLDFLQVIGVSPPKSQEMFWRIPSNISIDGLRKRARYLKQGLSGELTDVPTSQEESSAEVDTQETFEQRNVESSMDDEISKDEPIQDSTTDQTSRVLRNVDNILDNQSVLSVDNKKNKKKKRILLDDDEENEESLRLHLDTEPTQEFDKLINKKADKKRRIIMDDDENNEESLQLHLDTGLTQEHDKEKTKNNNNKRRIIMDDDDDDENEESLQLHLDTETIQEPDSEAHVKSRIYDSDEDSEDTVVKPLKKHSQLKAVLDDSDED